MSDLREHPVVVYAHGNPANALTLLGLAAFLGAVIYQGNAGNLFGALRADFVGDATHAGFWKWGLAVLILYWLASNANTNKIFGPVLVFAIVAMLIYAAERQPQLLQNLNSAVDKIFGQGNALNSILGSL